MLDTLLSQTLLVPVLATVALFAAVAAVRFLVGRRIRAGATILGDEQRRQLFYLRSGLTAALLVGLLAIWLGQLGNALLSLTAVAVAVVIATKELLMCVSGFLLRTTGRLFSLGDWIECNGLRGEVADHTVLSTRLLEVEWAEHGYAYTGRTVTLPNSLFLTHPVRTATFARRFVLHRFRITLETPQDATAARAWLQARAEELCAPFADEARRQSDVIERELGVEVAGPEPAVALATTDLGKIQLAVELFCPTSQAAELEREITGGFLGAAAAGTFALPGDAAATAPGLRVDSA